MRALTRLPTSVLACVACCTLSAASNERLRPQPGQPEILGLLDRYERGEHDRVIATLEATDDVVGLAGDLERHFDRWILSRGSAEAARRLRVAAVFTLELAGLRLTSWSTLRVVAEKACARIRQGPPTPFERLWHLAIVATAAGAGDKHLLLSAPYPAAAPQAIGGPFGYFGHADHAAKRVPDEVRFYFAAAILEELPLFEPNRDDRTFVSGLSKDKGERAINALKKFVDHPSVGAEAHLRIGYFYYCLNDLRGAATHYEAALQTARDPFIRYLGHFLVGRLFESSGRRQDAATAYRRALEVLPLVQSGTMALSATLFLDEKPDEAYALLNAAFAVTPRPVDPWRVYGQGDFRFLPDLMGQLREHIRQ